MKHLLTMAAFAAVAAVVLPVQPLHAQSTSTGSVQAYPTRPVRYVVAFAAGDSELAACGAPGFCESFAFS